MSNRDGHETNHEAAPPSLKSGHSMVHFGALGENGTTQNKTNTTNTELLLALAIHMWPLTRDISNPIFTNLA